jgi:pimeloyl-ACP methyl ester carboxylesterase
VDPRFCDDGRAQADRRGAPDDNRGLRARRHESDDPALAEADLRDVLPRVQIPTLLIWGDADVRSALQVAESIQSRIPGSRLVVIPRVGHLSHMEAPERFN